MKQLQCGFAQIDITPSCPEEVFLDGYGNRLLPAQGVRDPIYAKVCVMQWETEEFAVISLDICGLNNGLKNRLCGLISTLAQMDREKFAVCATHTHAAPACGVLANLPINMMYWNQVAEKVSQAILQARADSKPGCFRFTVREDFTLPLNRRGKEDINRNIWVCGFYDDSKTLQGVVTAASCHAVCNTEYTISADFPGVLTRRAAEAFPGVPFLYLQSRGADINPPCSGEEGIESVGNELTDSVLRALADLQQAESTQGPLKSAFETIAVPMRYLPKADLEAAIDEYADQLRSLMDNNDARRYPEIELQWHLTALQQTKVGNIAPTLPVDLQVVTIDGQAVFAFVPFEVLTATGNAIEQAIVSMGIDREKCLVIGYANGTNSYLCPANECGQYGYETRIASHWYMLPECTKQTEPAVIETLADLTKSLLQSMN